MGEETDAAFEPLVLRWDEDEFVAAEAVRVFCEQIGEVDTQRTDHVDHEEGAADG